MRNTKVSVSGSMTQRMSLLRRGSLLVGARGFGVYSLATGGFAVRPVPGEYLARKRTSESPPLAVASALLQTRPRPGGLQRSFP